MKSLYESAISGAITILNDQIDELETAKEEAVEALENARDAEIKPLEEKVKALEKEKEEMQKINEQRERELNLQKAQYDLERAQSQRNRLIYKNGQMSYVNDNAEVRSTKESLESAIFDKKVGELDDQIDALNDQIDEINEKYDKLIEQTEKFYDDQIKGLQKMVKEWEKVQHAAEMADAIAALNQFGISVEDVLSGNVDAINMIRDGYIGVLTGLTDDVSSVAQAFDIPIRKATDLKNALLGYDANTTAFSQMKTDLEGVGDAIDGVIGKLGGETTETPSGEDNGNGLHHRKSKDATESNSTSNEGSTLSEAFEEIKSSADTTIAPISKEFKTMGENIDNTRKKLVSDTEEDSETLLGGIQLLKKNGEEPLGTIAGLFKLMEESINSCIGALKQLHNMFSGEDESFDVELVVNTLGSIVGGKVEYTGTAYANGNWSAKSKGIKTTESALVGELGEELVVDSKTGSWHTVGTNGAEFSQIKPNDIVFNHKQTEELLKNGKINSRGKAYASGKDNLFSPLSDAEMGKYSLNLTKDLTEKLEFGNQKLTNIDKAVATITNANTVNNSGGQTFNISNEFTCNGVSLAEVQSELARAFEGIFVSAYQRSMK